MKGFSGNIDIKEILNSEFDLRTPNGIREQRRKRENETHRSDLLGTQKLMLIKKKEKKKK